VRIGVNRDQHTGFHGHKGQVFRKVKPRRVCVDLKRCPGACSGLKNTFPFVLGRRSLLDDSSRRMGDDIDVRVLNRLQ
jgi:hypothetical protein